MPQELPKLDGHILLVEDGPDNQRLIAFILQKAGARVTVAENGRAAIEKITASNGCLDAGCDDYLSKPIERRALLETVARHLVPVETGNRD